MSSLSFLASTWNDKEASFNVNFDDDDDGDDGVHDGDEDDEHSGNNIHSKTSFAALLASRSLSATLMKE